MEQLSQDDEGFVEFKIYISLKHKNIQHLQQLCFVEFKIYISLKRINNVEELFESFVEFKIYISLKQHARANTRHNVL